MAEDRLDQLLAGYADGSLDEHDEIELEAALIASPEQQRRLARLLVVGRLLREAAKPALDTRRLLAALPRRPGATVANVMRDIARPRRRTPPAALWGGGLVLAAAASLALVAGFRSEGRAPTAETLAPARTPKMAAMPVDPAAAQAAGPRAVVEGLEGPAWRQLGETSVRLQHNDTVGPGETLRTTAGHGSVTVRFPDGTRLTLGAASRLTVEPPAGSAAAGPAAAGTTQVSLGGGTLLIEAGSALGQLTTPHARLAPAPAARLHVAVSGPRTRVDLRAGGARVEGLGGARTATLAAGQFALVGEGAAAGGLETGRTKPRAVMVSGTIEKNGRLEGDRRLADRLSRLGFEVVRRTDAEATTTDARGAAVVLISSTVDIAYIGTRFRNVDAPVVVTEPWLLDDMGMTAAGQVDNQSFSHEELVLVGTDSPLSAGLPAGRVKVASTRVLTGWGRPNGVAIAIASAADGALERATIFAYEKGAAMPGLEAPARRAFFFSHDGAALSLNDNGWALFDAVLLWAAGGT